MPQEEVYERTLGVWPTRFKHGYAHYRCCSRGPCSLNPANFEPQAVCPLRARPILILPQNETWAMQRLVGALDRFRTRVWDSP